MAKRQINYELLEKVKMRLKRMRHPQHFNMYSWADETSCGTTACIAGYGLIVNGEMTPKKLLKTVDETGDILDEAIKAFGLTEEQAIKLFYIEDWPDDLAQQYDEAWEPATRRDIAVTRIQRFIDTRGAS